MRLSLIIPTRDRANYLGACLDAALAVPAPDFEIIVCDNASTDHTQEVLAVRAHDPRIRVKRQKSRVSMRMNFETGLNEAKGDYLIFIGDDDAILPGQIPILLDLLHKRAPDVLSWTPLNYGWPITGFSRHSGRLRLKSAALFGVPEVLDVPAALQSLYTGDFSRLPSLYHGAVARRFLDQIAAADGVVFGGSVPDVYFGIRALHQGGDFLMSGHPFSINGYSPASTGHAHHAYKSDDPRAAPARRFAEEARADPLPDKLAHIHSVPGAVFVTLETVRARISAPVSTVPDYAAWYARVLGAIRPRDNTARASVMETLTAHAEAEGTQAKLEIALAAKEPLLRIKKARLSSPSSTIPITARRGKQNTVLTAAQTLDMVLGSSYADVLSGLLSRDAAWRAARRRALGLGIKRLFASQS